jgi:hypothetical protein
MHIYLKNKTGDDGGIYPEIFNDLALSESVNGLYAFAIACVMTDNFTNTTQFLKDYPSKEVATLGLIQYIKGVATTVQLNNKCVNPMYNNLLEISQLGSSPTLLNLDGDLFYKHYDTNKYFSKEASDAAEDSFPYWVINIVKEITTCMEIIKPTSKTFELPYYIQNISNENISILSTPNNIDKNNIIGKLPPSGIDAIVNIKNGYGVLGSAENAYILLSDKLQPIKHVVDLSELNLDNGTLKLPNGEFDIEYKTNIQFNSSYGINSHYYAKDKYFYNNGDTTHIKGVFRNAGIIEDGVYIQIHSDFVSIKQTPMDHTKNDKVAEIKEVSSIPTAFSDCKYLVIISTPSEDAAHTTIMNILKKSPYKNAYIDVDLNDKFTVVVHGDNDSTNAIKVKKKILGVFGYKALVIEYDKFYK